jgi:hypothetical protein
VTVTVEPVNDNAPELSLVPMGLPYIEGTPAGVELVNDVILTDVDHNDVFNLTALHVSSGSSKKGFLQKWYRTMNNVIV